MTRTRRSAWLAIALGVVATLAEGAPTAAQDAPPAAVATRTPLAPLPISPRGALIRAMVLPGWGHAAIGAYSRGAFYFAFEGLTAYTMLRTRNRLGDARERAAFRENFLRSGLAADGVTDPALIEAALGQDGVLKGLDALVASRENQQEDLVAFGIFLVFLTGADAFVSAHLARFPAPIPVQAQPTADGGLELAVRVPLPR